MHDAEAASPTSGQPWAYQQIQDGDKVCAANQDLHPEAVNLIKKIERNNYYRAKVADPLSPITFVHKIHAPVFMACQWTDEQTGGHCPSLPVALHRHRPEVVHVHERRPRRLARPEDVQPLVRLLRALRRAAETRAQLGPEGRGAGHLQDRDGRRRRPPAQRPDPAEARLRLRPRRVREVAVGADPVRQRSRRRSAGRPGRGLQEVVQALPAARAPTLAPGTWETTAPCSHDKGAASGAETFNWDPAARPPTDFTGDTGSGRVACGRRRPTTSGRRARPATRSPTSASR